MKCVEVCPCDAITFDNNQLITNYELCEYCGNCSLYCINLAKQLVGKDYTMEELVKEIMRLNKEKVN